MLSPGEMLVRACRATRRGALLVAPFIKRDSLARLLADIAPQVPVVCVTRWRPLEVRAGVSDLSIWDLLRSRDHATLWLRHDLHAKYYRLDDTAIIGSANLTAAALQWSARPNFELLHEVPALAFGDFERTLLSGCIRVDDDIAAAVAEAVASLPDVPIAGENDQPIEQPPGDASVAQYEALDKWLPMLRSPEALFDIYSGSEDVTHAVRDAGTGDLSRLAIPRGLTRQAFERSVGATLLQLPIVRLVDQLLGTSRRFGEIRDVVGERLAIDREEASLKWQTLMRWLRHFLPGRYELTTPHYSEILRRRGDGEDR